MFVSDFLSRHPGHDPSPRDEIIPITFLIEILLEDSEPGYDMYSAKEIIEVNKEILTTLEVITEKNNPLEDLQYTIEAMVTTRSQSRQKGEDPKPIYPLKGDHKKPEHQTRVEKTPSKSYEPRQEIPSTDIPEPTRDTNVYRPELFPRQRKIEKNVENIHEHDREPISVPNACLPRMPQPTQRELTRPPENMNEKIAPFKIIPELQDNTTPYNKQQIDRQNIEKTILDPTNTVPFNIRLQGYIPQFNDNYKEPEQEARQPDTHMYRKGYKLFERINDRDILRKHLPKQRELDKYLNKLRQKVINNYEVPLSVKEIIPEQKRSPFFKDIYKYIRTGRIPVDFSGKAKIELIRDASNYVIIENVLFRIPIETNQTYDSDLKLCIPEVNIPHLLYYYHDSLLAGHQGVNRTYKTITQKFYVPFLFDSIRNYILSCDTCQRTRLQEQSPKAHHVRIPFDFKPMTSLSCDIKYMPTSNNQYKYILFATCDVSGYVVAMPLVKQDSISIAEALLNKVVWQFGPPKTIIFDEGANFSSEVMSYIYQTLRMKPLVVSPGNHGSLKTERYIRTISEMITKVISNTGSNWPFYLNASCYAHNTFVSTVTGYSPFELVYLHKPVDIVDIAFDPFQGRTREVGEYIETMKKRFNIMKRVIEEKKIREQNTQKEREMRRYPDERGFAVGDLVYLYAPPLAALQTTSRKFKQNWIGPLQIQAVLDDTHYMLSDWKGRLLPFFGSVHKNRLKHCYINLGKMIGNKIATVNNSRDLIEKWKELYPEEIPNNNNIN